jgi:hypothetical protein
LASGGEAEQLHEEAEEAHFQRVEEAEVVRWRTGAAGVEALAQMGQDEKLKGVVEAEGPRRSSVVEVEGQRELLELEYLGLVVAEEQVHDLEEEAGLMVHDSRQREEARQTSMADRYLHLAPVSSGDVVVLAGLG